MSQSLIYFFIGIGLSLDAFSLSLALGTNNISKNKKIVLIITIGLCHLFMPLLGSAFGQFISTKIITNTNIISSIIFFYLSFELKPNTTKKKYSHLNLITIFLIALIVSIDSLSVGLVLGLNKENVLIASIIFMITSSIFTYLGIIIGQKIQEKYHILAIYLGKLLLLLIAIKYLLAK